MSKNFMPCPIFMDIMMNLLKACQKVDLSDTDNRLILLGDYIDGGTQSFQVIAKILN